MKNESLFSVITGLIYTLTLIVFGTIVRGFALITLWKWFMVPFGLPALGIAWAIGVGLTLNYLLGIDNTTPKDESQSYWEGIVIATVKILLTPAFTLAFGWVIHQYM